MQITDENVELDTKTNPGNCHFTFKFGWSEMFYAKQFLRVSCGIRAPKSKVTRIQHFEGQQQQTQKELPLCDT